MISLKDAAIFTILDLLSVFHQVELTPNSFLITNFQSGSRIKRFIRLIFGINSSQKDLQHALTNFLIDIDGAMNISCVIFSYGKNETEQDKIKKKTLKILGNLGLTLIFGKNFTKTCNIFWNEKFTKYTALHPPANVKEVQSFFWSNELLQTAYQTIKSDNTTSEKTPAKRSTVEIV